MGMRVPIRSEGVVEFRPGTRGAGAGLFDHVARLPDDSARGFGTLNRHKPATLAIYGAWHHDSSAIMSRRTRRRRRPSNNKQSAPDAEGSDSSWQPEGLRGRLDSSALRAMHRLSLAEERPMMRPTRAHMIKQRGRRANAEATLTANPPLAAILFAARKETFPCCLASIYS